MLEIRALNNTAWIQLHALLTKLQEETFTGIIHIAIRISKFWFVTSWFHENERIESSCSKWFKAANGSIYEEIPRKNFVKLQLNK